jgi:hypothetical protein
LWPYINGSVECRDPVQAEVVAMLHDVRVR